MTYTDKDGATYMGNEALAFDHKREEAALRDEFAMRAMQAFMSYGTTWGREQKEHVVRHAYEIADMMMEARK